MSVSTPLPEHLIPFEDILRSSTLTTSSPASAGRMQLARAFKSRVHMLDHYHYRWACFSPVRSPLTTAVDWSSPATLPNATMSSCHKYPNAPLRIIYIYMGYKYVSIGHLYINIDSGVFLLMHHTIAKPRPECTCYTATLPSVLHLYASQTNITHLLRGC